MTTDELVDFMVRLSRIDKRRLVLRDFLVLWIIRRRPGIQGFDLARMLGYANRSPIQSNIQRLLRESLVEDRRPHGDPQHTPNQLHITPAGEEFWQEVTK